MRGVPLGFLSGGEQKMVFLDWQLDRLRRGVNRYRGLRGDGGQGLPWKTIAHRINRSPAAKAIGSKGFDEAELEGEALRRFVEKAGRLQPPKPSRVAAFLIEEHLLTKADLDPKAGSFQRMVPIVDVLTLATRSGDLPIHDAARFEGVQSVDGAERQVSLYLKADPSRTFYIVEEQTLAPVDVEELGAKPGDYSVNGGKMGRLRLGIGILSTSRSLLHIFLCGHDGADRATYLEVAPTENASRDLYLVDTERPADLQFQPGSKSSIQNVTHFVFKGEK